MSGPQVRKRRIYEEQITELERELSVLVETNDELSQENHLLRDEVLELNNRVLELEKELSFKTDASEEKQNSKTKAKTK